MVFLVGWAIPAMQWNALDPLIRERQLKFAVGAALLNPRCLSVVMRDVNTCAP